MRVMLMDQRTQRNHPFTIPKPLLLQKLRSYLDIDIGFGDLSSGVIPSDAIRSAKILAKSEGILAGAEEACLLFEDLGLTVTQEKFDGEPITLGEKIFLIEGNLRNILMIERTALDFLMKLSSIATSTHDLVLQIRNANLNTILATTRKVTPGFGWFEKKAVFFGGGDTHRWNLSDMVMFKDTHLAYYHGDVSQLLHDAKKTISFSKKIEIEIEQVEDIGPAITGGADIIMLDNMTPEEIQKALSSIEINRDRVLFEASGNITVENIMAYARSGVDIISTSSTVLRPQKFMDFSLRLI